MLPRALALACLVCALGSPISAQAKKKRTPRPTPLPTVAPSATPDVPDVPFTEARPSTPRPRTAEAAVFASFRTTLAGVIAIRAVEKGGTATGSAFLVHATGLLLTNDHVVRGATEIQVRFSDGRTYAARLAGADPALDLAVLRITAEKDEAFPVAVLGDSDRIEEGDPVLALGNPLGLGNTITRGILSGKDRRVDVGAVGAAGTPVAFLQTDAAVNPGSSGGPLTDLDGAVIGVTTATVPGARGVAFAIPVNVVKKALPGMLRNAGAGRAFLGLTLGVSNGSGAEVLSVRPGGPAARAGLKTGDIVTALRGRTISTDDDLAEAVRDLAMHETVRVLYVRRGRVSVAEITVTEVPVPAVRVTALELGGAVIAEFGPESEAAVRSGQSTGVLFVSVPKASAAEKSGLQPGDVLMTIGMDAVVDLDDVRILLDRSTADGFRILVQRGEKTVTVIVAR